MVIYKKYSLEQYKAFLSNSFSSNFGMSEDKTLNWFFSQHGAQTVISRYGLTKSNMKNTYIPYLNKHLGGYFMFLAITVQEGGGAGNWINHYPASVSSSNGMADMKPDVAYINSLLNSKAYPVSLSAPEVNGGLRVPEDNPGTAKQLLDSLGYGTIGRYYMPATMAGNAWVFATNWCINHQGPAPGAYFGNPYDAIIDVIKSAGADPFKNHGGGKPQPPIPVAPMPPNTLETDPVELFKKALRAMLKDLHSINNPNIYYNFFLKILKQLNNTYKITANFDIDQLNLNSINEIFGGKPPESNHNDQPGGGSGGAGQNDYWWPFLGQIQVTSPYGYRDASIGSGAFHQGIDMVEVAHSGRYIYAIHAGTVTISSDRVPGWEAAGSMILIKNDGDNKIVTYEEFKPGSMMVRVGQHVKGGQKIAVMGVSGNSTGEHLHLGINTKGLAPLNPYNWANPAPYIGIQNAVGIYSKPPHVGYPG